MATLTVTHIPYRTGVINTTQTYKLDFSGCGAYPKGQRAEAIVKVLAGSAAFEVGPEGTIPDTTQSAVLDSTTNTIFPLTIWNDNQYIFFTPAACGFSCAITF